MPLPSRRGPHVADPRDRANRCCSIARRSSRRSAIRRSGHRPVLSGCADRRRRRGDRRRSASRARREEGRFGEADVAPPDDDRGERRRRDPERPAVPRDPSPGERDGRPRRRRAARSRRRSIRRGPGAHRRARAEPARRRRRARSSSPSPTARPSRRSSVAGRSPSSCSRDTITDRRGDHRQRAPEPRRPRWSTTSSRTGRAMIDRRAPMPTRTTG